MNLITFYGFRGVGVHKFFLLEELSKTGFAWGACSETAQKFGGWGVGV